jgi:hypothetical protein
MWFLVHHTVLSSGNLNFLEPSGPLQACNGTDFTQCYLLAPGPVSSVYFWSVSSCYSDQLFMSVHTQTNQFRSPLERPVLCFHKNMLCLFPHSPTCQSLSGKVTGFLPTLNLDFVNNSLVTVDHLSKNVRAFTAEMLYAVCFHRACWVFEI